MFYWVIKSIKFCFKKLVKNGKKSRPAGFKPGSSMPSILLLTTTLQCFGSDLRGHESIFWAIVRGLNFFWPKIALPYDFFGKTGKSHTRKDSNLGPPCLQIMLLTTTLQCLGKLKMLFGYRNFKRGNWAQVRILPGATFSCFS